MSFVQKRGESRGGFLSLVLKRLVDYIFLLFLWIVNGHRIINVLKGTFHPNVFASKYVHCLFYGNFCEGICMCVALDVLRPWKRPGKKGMLRLGMGWALAACSWLCLDFWKAPSKKPCPGLIHSSSHRRFPPRVSPYKAEDISFRQPRLWPCSLKLSARSKVTQVKTGLPFQGSSPSVGQYQPLGNASVHEYFHWNAKLGSTNPLWGRIE